MVVWKCLILNLHGYHCSSAYNLTPVHTYDPRNWKHRSTEFYDDLLFMARAYNSTIMEKMLLRGFNTTQVYLPLEENRNATVDVGHKRLTDLVHYIDQHMEKLNFPVV